MSAGGSGRYALGIDFGTESGRAVLVDCADGRELGTAVHVYANGVLDECLPGPYGDVRLEADWALQDPDDYVAVYREAVPALLAETGVDPAEVVGVGIDFTSCTMLPATADGTPLCRLEGLRGVPHAWVKLWKHHAAQPEADRINAVAAERGEPWLPRYGGKISSEWFVAKSLQILDEAPEVYARAERLIDAGDWAVWQLTGVETRSAAPPATRRCGRSGTGSRTTRTSPRSIRASSGSSTRSCRAPSLPLGARAGGLTEEAAGWTGLRPGTPVAVANVDAHVSAPAVTVTEPGTMVAIMGTSTCHILLGEEQALVEGMCGVVEDGVVPGLYGFEAGQSAVGDIFGWFVESCVPPGEHEAAHRRGLERARRARAARRRGSSRVRAACSRSTGGTATARCSSTPSSAACSSA